MDRIVNGKNIVSYLGFLEKELNRQIAVPGGITAWVLKSDEEVTGLLSDLYQQLQIPRQKGWNYEDRFLKATEKAVPQPVPVVEDKIDVAPRADTDQPLVRYHQVNPTIGRHNYPAYIHWLNTQGNYAFDPGLTLRWGALSDEQIRSALPQLYKAAGITPYLAKQYELAFIDSYQPDSRPELREELAVSPLPLPVINVYPESIPLPVATPAPAPQPVTQRMSGTAAPAPVLRKKRSLLLRLLPAGLILLLLLFLGVKYMAYAKLPYVYALTENIALRKEAFDNAAVVGRMDTYPHPASSTDISVSSLKLAKTELDNGYYTVWQDAGFWQYLTGNENIMFVHSKFVTKDKIEYQTYHDRFINLKDDLNELDKLGFQYRKLIAGADLRAADGTALVIAASCDPSKTISKNVPLSIGKYRNKSTGALIALVQVTTGDCYAVLGSERSDTSSVQPVMLQHDFISEPLKGPGMFRGTGDGSLLRFERCADNAVFIARPPYTTFYPLIKDPVVVPEVPDEPEEMVDTAIAE